MKFLEKHCAQCEAARQADSEEQRHLAAAESHAHSG